MDRPTVLVCGLARCGTSLMMRMLHRGGMDVFADNHSAYEHGLISGPTVISVHAHRFVGKAAKILDPHRHVWPKTMDARVIWLDRNAKEQAKSQVKFLRLIGGLSIPGQSWRAIAKALPRDREACMALFCRIKTPVLAMDFEDLLNLPEESATIVNDFIGGFLSVPQMVACAERRSPKCAADVSMELRLSEEEMRRTA